MNFSERLKGLRQRKELSQRELAKMLNMAPSTLAMYEVGKREPDYTTLQMFADFFNVTTDYLLGRTDKQLSPAGGTIKEPSHQYGMADDKGISLKDEVDREVEAFREKGITIDRVSARKIVEHRRLVLQGKERCIEYVFEAKTLANALERIAELDFEFNFDDETMGKLVKKAREKYGLPKADYSDPAAHGPSYPGSGIFDKNNDGEDEA